MGHKNHDWGVGKTPPVIRSHSLAKHRVLRGYLERYISVLTANPRLDQFRLTLVDGFAGGGIYLDARSKEERSGSPLIMLEAMDQAAEAAKASRLKPFHLDVQYIFVEKDAETIDYLRSVISKSKHAPLLADRIQLLQGEFTAKVPEITAFVKQRGRAERAIFVLDQFGYIDVPLPTIRNILATVDKAEVFMTFAVDFLIDYLSENEATQQTLAKIGITLPSKTIGTAKESRDWRRSIQLALHEQIRSQTAAKFYTPFFIRSEDSHRDFWLVHLSGHFRARDVMVGLHWKENRSFAHYGGSGLQMLGYDPKYDSDLTRQRMLPEFHFDQTARASSHEELLRQLPERIFPSKDGITFQSLFSSLTNECPVTAEIMKDVLNDLAKDGTIRVQDKQKLIIRRAGIRHDSDIILPNPQRRLFT